MSITGNTASPPYSSFSDRLSNVHNFKVIDSSLLREGEQFANAWFSRETKIKIQQYRDDCEAICKLGLKAKILTQTRCTLDDAKLADQELLREHALDGKDMTAITKQAIEVIDYIKGRGCEVRFSSEDSFRSDLVDLLPIYRAATAAGVGRVGVADTVGGASPRQDLVRTLRGCVSTDIEVHFYDDMGFAVAVRSIFKNLSQDQKLTIKNSFNALEAGATHVDTSVLGIGGICPLGAFMARMMPTSRDYILSKYKLDQLKALEDFVAKEIELNVPFNNPVTGFCAFTHKAGIHAKAILNNPSTYEILKPEDFGLSRQPYRNVDFTSRLTGWNAIKSRVEQLGLKMTDDQIKELTVKIKQKADVKVMTLDESDALIRSFHLELQNGDGGKMD
ncbi:Homocitrate synthase, mitochondrial [Neonectria ditissima]|uniref:Homocitrate synthase, mitochondrial n=1 Tax=Neonectria ditissima TaxID=78410 RepID=A0A0P7BW99_9HYPO|nr:Homocitrate synthase, mitochondrial [Neonectria ditissima]